MRHPPSIAALNAREETKQNTRLARAAEAVAKTLGAKTVVQMDIEVAKAVLAIADE